MVSLLRAGVKTAAHGVVICEFLKEQNVQDSALSGYSDVFWNGKGMVLLNFLETGQTINSGCSIATLSELKAVVNFQSQPREEVISLAMQ